MPGRSERPRRGVERFGWTGSLGDWGIVAGIVSAVVGVVAALAGLFGGGDPTPTKERAQAASSGRIRLSEVLVRNPPSLPRIVTPTLELVVHNVGERRATLTRMQFTVRDQVFLPTCYIQGDLPVAEEYAITVPRKAKAGTVVNSSPLRRQLAVDQVERLAFRFRLPPTRENGKIVPYTFDDDNYLYRFDVGLVRDNRQTAEPLGTAIVSLPFGPSEGQIWTTDNRTKFVDGLPADAVACMKANAAKLRTFLEGPGERSGQMRSLQGRLSPDA
jgi:hypothetical protein